MIDQNLMDELFNRMKAVRATALAAKNDTTSGLQYDATMHKALADLNTFLALDVLPRFSNTVKGDTGLLNQSGSAWGSIRASKKVSGVNLGDGTTKADGSVWGGIRPTPLHQLSIEQPTAKGENVSTWSGIRRSSEKLIEGVA